MKRPRLLAGEDLPEHPQQRRSRQKRTRLMSAALALFAEHGYDATSIQQIARRAGVAVGGFYLHFRSKRQLLLALMDELIARLAEFNLVPGTSDQPQRIVRVLLHRAFTTDFEYLGAYRAWREAALTDPDLARRELELHAWTTARVRMVFGRLLELPGARTRVEVRALARLMDDLFWSLMSQAPRMKPSERRAAINAAAHLVYHALFTDPLAGGRV
jgi:AcrR family transcriptional regulator